MLYLHAARELSISKGDIPTLFHLGVEEQPTTMVDKVKSPVINSFFILPQFKIKHQIGEFNQCTIFVYDSVK